jgi:hypothetical protein
MRKQVLEALDYWGLSKGEFRVAVHIAIHGRCEETLRCMAATCRMHRDYLRVIITQLVARKMMVKVIHPGCATVLHLRPVSEWQKGKGFIMKRDFILVGTVAGQKVYAHEDGCGNSREVATVWSGCSDPDGLAMTYSNRLHVKFGVIYI